MGKLSRNDPSAAAALAWAVANEPVHDVPPENYGHGHSLEAAPMRPPMSAVTGFQLSCIGLGASLLLLHFGKTVGAMAPLYPAGLVMLPGMLALVLATGFVAWRHKRG